MNFDDLLQQVDAIAYNDIPAMLSGLAAIQAKLAMRLILERDGSGAAPEAKAELKASTDRLINVKEASALTGFSEDFLYKHSVNDAKGRLPFARRFGRSVRFSEAGIQRWIRDRTDK